MATEGAPKKKKAQAGQEAPKGAARTPELRLQNVSKRLHHFFGQDLKPGDVSQPFAPEHHEAIRKAPCVTGGKGLPPELVEIRGEPMPMPPARPPNIAEADQDEVLGLIARETDLEVLMAWAEQDQRPIVQSAIMARVEGLG